MEKKTLTIILEEKILQIPDYQRKYEWEVKQQKDFVHDIDSLIEYNIISHAHFRNEMIEEINKLKNIYKNQFIEYR